MRALLPLLLLAACDEADPSSSTFSAYDPDNIGMEDPSYELVPVVDDGTEERGTGSFGARRTAVTIPPRAGVNVPVVGFTPATKGRWVWPGARVGPLSGAAACGALFAGSHMCSIDETLASDAGGAFTGLPDTEMWLGTPTVNGARVNLSDTCQGYTYEGAHLAWKGGGFSWATDPATGDQSLRYETATGAAYDAECLTDLTRCSATVPSGQECNTPRRIACCR
jgi:hypothetical protein